jgi:hypothetical protein
MKTVNDSIFSLLNLQEIEVTSWLTFFFCYLTFLIWPYFPFLLFSSILFYYFPLSASIPFSVSLYIFLPFFTLLLFNFCSCRFSFLLSFLHASLSPFLYTSYLPGQHLSNTQNVNSTPIPVLRAPLCGSSTLSPRSRLSQIQADYSFHLVLGPMLFGNLSPMLPVRLHDTAGKPTRKFATWLCPYFLF